MGKASGHRSHTRKPLLIIVALVCLIALILLSVRSCMLLDDPSLVTSQSETSDRLSDDELADLLRHADVVIEAAVQPGTSAMEQFDQLDRDHRVVDPVCDTVLDLYMASGPGRPESTAITGLTAVREANQPASSRTELRSDVSVLTPSQGDVLIAGSAFVLTWLVDSERPGRTANVSLSLDGGASFTEIVTGMDDLGACDLIIPNWPSEQCQFRVDVFVSSVPLDPGFSPLFVIADSKPTDQPTSAPSPTPSPEPTPTPTPTPTPSPSPTPTPEPSPTPTPEPVYTVAQSPFIDQSGDPTRWFLLDLEPAEADRIDTIIWQVARTSFFGLANQNSLEPPGLLASGKVDPAEREFSIDFAAIINQTDDPESGMKLTGGTVHLPQRQYTLFVRAVAVDAFGRLLGDPGKGQSLIFGQIADEPLTGAWETMTDELFVDIEVPKNPPVEGIFEGGFIHDPQHAYFIYPEHPTGYFYLNGVPTDMVEMDLQVTTIPFASSAGSLREPDGLVKRQLTTKINYTTVSRTEQIDFSSFVPAVETLGDQAMIYYVRAVFYRPSGSGESLTPVLSETQKVLYTNNHFLETMASLSATMQLPVNTVKVATYEPFTRFISYTPVQWEWPDSEKYYEVTRLIKAGEINFSIVNKVTGDFLLPYPLHQKADPEITLEEYQAIIDRMLPVGAWFPLTIVQSAWDSFWNEFSSLLSAIYSAVREAYSDIKDTVINGVVDYIPLIDEDTRETLRDIVRSVVDVGLAVIGLPPEMPNLEGLAANGLDYCIEVAVDTICADQGIPIDQISDEIKDRITAELGEEFARLGSVKHLNPLDVDYLKPATKAAYQPAWVEILVNNLSDGISPRGTLSIDYSPVNKSYYDFYEPVRLPVPSLLPGDYTYIRVYLKQDIESYDLYRQYYFGSAGDCLLNIRIEYDFPDLDDAIASQDLSSQLEPLMKNEYAFDHSPIYTYQHVGPPCDAITTPDNDVNVYDYYKQKP